MGWEVLFGVRRSDSDVEVDWAAFEEVLEAVVLDGASDLNIEHGCRLASEVALETDPVFDLRSVVEHGLFDSV